MGCNDIEIRKSEFVAKSSIPFPSENAKCSN